MVGMDALARPGNPPSPGGGYGELDGAALASGPRLSLEGNDGAGAGRFVVRRGRKLTPGGIEAVRHCRFWP